MRKMPAFTKAPPETIERFEAATSGIDALERRTMFSYPSVFLNGNMLACVFQDRIMVRLSAIDRAVFLAMPNGKVFEPSPGRPMHEYVEAPSAKEMAIAELRGWIQRAAAHVATLPKKSKTKKAPVKKAAAEKKASALKAKARAPARAAKKSRGKGARKRR
jgi:TfoX/Sxy family transcriptional regulator of competence genes